LPTSKFATDFEICRPRPDAFHRAGVSDDDFLSLDDTTHTRAQIARGQFMFPGKEHLMAKVGTVKFFNADKGYGFIQPDDGSPDSFVHISAVQAAGMDTLDRDQRVNYEVQSGRDGKESAVNLSRA
jgi:CspA family cold shock protein